jgi:hypothetical protein
MFLKLKLPCTVYHSLYWEKIIKKINFKVCLFLAIHKQDIIMYCTGIVKDIQYFVRPLDTDVRLDLHNNLQERAFFRAYVDNKLE